MNEFRLVLFVVCALAGWWFVVRYWWLTGGAWARTQAGRHMMGLTAVLAAICTLAAMRIAAPHYPGYPHVGTALYALGAIFMVHRAIILERLHWRRRRGPTE